MNDLIDNIHRLHTTSLGSMRIKRNLGLDIEDVIDYCKKAILRNHTEIYRKGKNWYAKTVDTIFTINAHSLTVITAHKLS